MKLRVMATHNLGLKLLSLIMAVVIWFFVEFGKETEISMEVPVRFENIPPGLVITGAPPSPINIRLKGQRIVLMKLRAVRPVAHLDLKGAAEGTTGFPNMERMINLPEGVRVTRVTPVALEVRLTKTAMERRGTVTRDVPD